MITISETKMMRCHPVLCKPIRDPENQETLLAQESVQNKKRNRFETALTILVPLLFVGFLSIVCYGVTMKY